MSEEIQTETVDTSTDTQVETNQEQSTPQYSDVELRAMEAGWKPKEEFTGEDGKWVDAGEFLRRGELFDKIDVLGRELKDTKKVLQMLKQHHEKVRETEYKRALEELKTAKKLALQEGDIDAVTELDDRIADFKAEARVQQQQQAAQANQPDPRFVAWVQKNSWYAQDQDLRAFADEAGVAYAKRNPDKSPEEVLDYTLQRVKKAFPEKFSNPLRSKPSAVESASTPKTKKADEFTLDEHEERAMKAFVRQGIMTKEEYIAEAKKVRGIK